MLLYNPPHTHTCRTELPLIFLSNLQLITSPQPGYSCSRPAHTVSGQCSLGCDSSVTKHYTTSSIVKHFKHPQWPLGITDLRKYIQEKKMLGQNFLKLNSPLNEQTYIFFTTIMRIKICKTNHHKP